MFVNLMVLMSRAQKLEIIKDLHNVMHITELQSLSSRNSAESVNRIIILFLFAGYPNAFIFFLYSGELTLFLCHSAYKYEQYYYDEKQNGDDNCVGDVNRLVTFATSS